MNNILYKKSREVSNEVKLLFIDFHYAQRFDSVLDNNLTSICRGRCSQDTLQVVKSDIDNYLKDKDDSKKIGAVAEFFAHLYFVNEGFKQECQFFNLEELSAKKRF